MSSNATMVGLALTLTVHGCMVLFALFYTPSDAALKAARPGESGSVGSGLCGVQRCRQPETRMKRSQPEEDPVSQMEVLEAALIPALGFAQADPDKLPKLQTYEQPEIVEEGVNLNENPEKLKDLVKEFDKKKAKRDTKKPLDKRLKDFREDDPRRRATDLSKIIGSAEGEVGGQADMTKAGNIYGAKVARALRRAFITPPFLGVETLKTLRVKVRISRLQGTGAIMSFRVTKRSGNRAFDDAAISAIHAFVPKEGGRKTLPRPDPAVLRYINTKGMKITLDGRLLSP
ncbi:MAG: TonB C-terminal domain-containing protein [Myxococcota bacterium]